MKRLVALLKGYLWLARPSGLRHQIDYLERQQDGMHGLFDQWQERFRDLFTRFEQQAQAILPDVLERQQQLGDKLSQLNAGFGAREARLTKWLIELQENGRAILDELRKQQEAVAQLRAAVADAQHSGAASANDRVRESAPPPATPAAAS
jgi:hypothetical protein